MALLQKAMVSRKIGTLNNKERQENDRFTCAIPIQRDIKNIEKIIGDGCKVSWEW